MTVEVAGTWDTGWSAPLTEMTQWWAVMRTYEIPMLHMCPVSGIKHNLLTEHNDFESLLRSTRLTPVFVDEDAPDVIGDFDHPDNALYIFGKAGFSPRTAFGAGHLSVRIDCQKLGMLWPHQALAIVMHDRGRP